MRRIDQYLLKLALLSYFSMSNAYDAVYVPIEALPSIPATPPTPVFDPDRDATAVIHPMAEPNSNGDPNAPVYQRQFSPERYKDTLPSIEKEMPSGNKVILLPGR
jgi:hypothetical protein